MESRLHSSFACTLRNPAWLEGLYSKCAWAVAWIRVCCRLLGNFMRLREMTKEDIPGGVRLNTVAGWNQTEVDWNRFLDGGALGCFVMEDGGRVIGTAATLCYQDRFAWISMVLVDPEYRNRGIGAQLLARAVQYLDESGIATLKLDATPLGKPLYEKMGFVGEYEIDRWVLRRTARRELATCDTNLAADELPEIFKLDCDLFGADRSPLLGSLHDRAPDLTLAAAKGTRLEGYAFGRRGLFADHLGPWMTTDRETARRLLEEFLRRSSRETVLVDAMKSNRAAGEILHESGFSLARPLPRMYRGSTPFPANPHP